MRKLPSLAAVRAFEASARLGTFTAAGVELGLSQAAVSYQIKVLEDQLGAPLFLRRGRRVELTTAGARAARRVSAAFDEVSSAFDELRGDDEDVLTISSTTTFATIWLARHLGRYQARQPKQEIRLEAGDRPVDFAAEDIDVAIRSGKGEWPGLTARRLMDIDFTPMCDPACLEGVSGPLPPSASLRMRRINPLDPWWATWFAQCGLERGEIHTTAGVRLDTQIATGQAALAGQGLAMLTPALWRAELEDGRLVRPFDQLATEGEAYWLVSATSRRNVRKIARFADWLKTELDVAR